MADPSPSSPPANQSLVLVPKIEPKPEPIELPNPNSPRSSLSSEIINASSSPEEEEALFAEYLRLTQLYLSSVSVSGVPGHGLVVSKKRKKKSRPRSAEMVRVSSLGPTDEAHFRALTRRARATFESLRLHVVRDEDRACALGLDKPARARADLRSAALMKSRGLWLNRDRRIIGAIPGVVIGDIYFFRMEICVVGLHGQVQGGIDYVPASRSSSGEPVATSIIVSGGYEDDYDNGLELIYTGQGGRALNAVKQVGDQKLDSGNLSLERSMAYGIEIRVIRGIKSAKSPTGKVYVYDGLYRVVECWFEVGKSGFGVYKYKLLRNEGQETMGSAVLKLAMELRENPLEVRPKGYLSLDMSMGKESAAISLFNDIDDDRDPLMFEYLSRPMYPPMLGEKIFGDRGSGCQCEDTCSIDCCCAKLNGGEFAYDPSGILIRGKPVVYECGPLCRCSSSCPNRVSQKGMAHRLEVFRSLETGWGVRSLDVIRAGEFICEFSGLVLSKELAEASSVSGDGFVIPSRFPGRWAEWGNMCDVFPGYVPPSYPSLPQLEFAIDVSRSRNVACYMSHSSCPNVFVQFVLYDHYNVAYPHLMIFALENVPPLRELSIDYGMAEEWIGKLTM